MDARHRKKKFNSISSILSKPDSSSTSKGFGCRVRFPIYSYSCAFVKGKEEEDGDEGETKGKEMVSFREVKREEEKRRDELKIKSEVCGNKIGEENKSHMLVKVGNKISGFSASSEEKEEDTSLNLGMGVGLMLLLTKSTTELSKMVELRKEMETLLIDIKNEIKKKNVSTSTDYPNNASISLSASGGNDNLSDCISPLQKNGASNHTDDRLDKSVVEIEEMEKELEAELKRLQLTEEISVLPPLLIGKIEPTDESNYLNDNYCDNFEGYTDYDEQPIEEESNNQKDQGNENGGYDNFNGGVSPHELDRRLNEVLQSRQRDRIEELEYALECAKRKLYEREKDICWWQDTAPLVTQHRDDSHFR